MQTQWWKNSIGYQIYIRSFFDGNNDGNGDLKGITNKLGYIKDLGVNFIWVCPFYDSPLDDNGYDIRNFYKIHEIYGNMEDLKTLIEEAHKLNIKVFIDLVLNHTSDENVWFIKSENEEEPYTDFYIWKNGKIKNDKIQPPNNWQSFFTGPAWKYSEKRQQYFLKIFSNKMPDINYESEIAFQEIEKVINFYADLKIDGFRVDAISHLGKDLSFSNVKNKRKSYKKFSNLSINHKYLKIFNKVFSKHNLVTMGELGGNPTRKDLLEYTTKKELDMVFNFEQTRVFTKNNKICCNKLLKTLKSKEQLSSNLGWSVLFWLNHDYPRLISKIKNEKDSKNAQICLACLMYMLKGTPIIYNGEEIGMQNYDFEHIEDFKDVNAKMIFENLANKQKAFEKLKENSRDNSRTIMQWNGEKNAGFSVVKPWNFVNKNYKNCNVEISLKDKNSILNNYKKIFKIRKDISKNLINARYKFFNKFKLIGYKIFCDKYNLEVIANLSSIKRRLNLKNKKVLYSNFAENNKLKKYQVVIIKSNK